MTSINNVIRSLVKNGKVTLGYDQARKALTREGEKPVVVIVARNCPKEKLNKLVELAKQKKVPVYHYEGTSEDLGITCGKPFFTLVVTVLDAGGVDVSPILKGAKVYA